jgi:hypothetical protein
MKPVEGSERRVQQLWQTGAERRDASRRNAAKNAKFTVDVPRDDIW